MYIPRLFVIRIASFFIFILTTVGATGCEDKSTPPPNDTSAYFIKGADISWITEMEASGKKLYTTAGIEKEGTQLMKELGMNAIRLRVWVNPSEGWNGLEDVINKALRAKQLGLKLMLDFHYSDSWADPGKQFPPQQWTSTTVAVLQDSIKNHTLKVLDALWARGVKPIWVQIGNETNDGMLWPIGKASQSMSNYAAFIKAGYEAVKSWDPNVYVIVHLSNGYDNSLFRWNLDGLRQYGATWDIIGMSLYPTAQNWSQLNQQCLVNMQDLIARYQTPVMICEVGMPWDQPNATYSFMTDLINKLKSLPDKMGLGIFYWEPQCYGNWKGYSLGAFDNNGRPTRAMNAFAN
jgi:arabinogalactan endo-1,4-beta-galactosidase